MWDEATRHRFQELRQRELDGTLSEAEQIELAQRIQELDDYEAACLAPALERLRQSNLQKQAQVEELTEQRRQLARLVEQKETYLAHARKQERVDSVCWPRGPA